VLAEARELAREGAIAGGTARNVTYLQSRVTFEGLDETDQLILCDAQTSGGLLLAVPPERLRSLLGALRQRKVDPIAEIGEITTAGDGRIRVVP
jgi:selenide,water dikinase